MCRRHSGGVFIVNFVHNFKYCYVSIVDFERLGEMLGNRYLYHL